jgi:acetyl-CoA acetyltransferase
MGVITPATWMSLNANRYFHRFGVTNEDCGRAVVATRRYAANNPAAWYYQRPITLDDHQNSRWIVEPTMRLLDCCQETDGAVAVIVTSVERARDLRQRPAIIEAAAMSAIIESEVATDHYRPDLSVMDTSVHLAQRLFGGFAVPREAIGAAMIYDAFSPLLLMQLEALGFCGLGEAKDFIAEGNIDIDGRLPVNTNGGLIGEGYIHGLNLVLEGVRQLRRVSHNQVRDIEHVLLTSSRGGAILGAG